MRLPQSISQYLSVRIVPSLTIGLAIAILLFGMVPTSAGTTAPQLICSPSSLRFGATDIGQAETLLVTVTNSGQTSTTISGITASNLEFSTSHVSLPLVLLAGESVDLSVTFTPSATGWLGATVKFYSNASNPTLQLDLEGTGVSSESLTASPATLSFGQVAVGGRSNLPLVLTNTRSWKVTLSGIQTVGSAFSMSGATFPVTLNAGQSVTLNVSFAPQSAGESGGSLYVIGPGMNIPLTGTGGAAGQLILSPAPLNFGNVPVGTTQIEPIFMNATGASVTVYSAASSSSQFILDGASFPFTIAAGQSLSFNVAFTPQNSGGQAGSLSFASNASNPQAIESLSGTGTVTQYSINLYWNPSLDVSGYNVYRSGSANGTYVKINSILDANTAYTDGTVASGQTYYYEATSVNSSGQESGRSTPPVQAIVP